MIVLNKDKSSEKRSRFMTRNEAIAFVDYCIFAKSVLD